MRTPKLEVLTSFMIVFLAACCRSSERCIINLSHLGREPRALPHLGLEHQPTLTCGTALFQTYPAFIPNTAPTSLSTQDTLCSATLFHVALCVWESSVCANQAMPGVEYLAFAPLLAWSLVLKKSSSHTEDMQRAGEKIESISQSPNTRHAPQATDQCATLLPTWSPC